METINGTINSMWTKDVTTKYGDRKVYMADVDGKTVNLGFKTPYEEGENVSFNVDYKYGEYQVMAKGAKKAGGSPSNGTSAPIKSGVSASSVPHKPAFPVDKSSKDMSIIRQNSAGHAARMVSAMLAAGDVPMADESSPTPEEVMELFFNFAYQITDFSTGHREEKMVEEMND